MDAQDLLRSGDLAGARSALAGELRGSPANTPARQAFWQLLAVAGEWDKAENQLRTLSTTEPKAMMLGSVYNQVLKATRQRGRVLAGQERAKSLVGSEPWVEGLFDALEAGAQGRADAGALSDAALEAAPATPGTIDGEAFEWIADADARFGPMMEAIIGDQYGLVPFAALKRVRFQAPEDLRDTVWLPVELETLGGQTSMAFMPVLYPGTAETGDAQLMLGRRTDWVERGGADRGLGQRLLATDAGEYPVLSARDLRLG